MYFETADYRIIPSIVMCGRTETISIIPLGEYSRFEENTEYTVTFIPMELCNKSHSLEYQSTGYDTLTVKPENGSIRFHYTFTGEQEWVIKISNPDQTDYCRKFRIYSLLPDLYERRPYKGDLHVHSCRSDGNEEPAIVAANYRKHGFDFMAITDHFCWTPSREAIERYKEMPINLRLFYGEEVHIPSGYIHMINFGGRYSVNDLYRSDKQRYDAQIEEYAKSITVPEGINALEYSYRRWIHEKIREGGGLSILVHPNWIVYDEYNMQTTMTEYIIETGCYDAFEIIGGQSVRENNMQTAFYCEQRAKGRKIPIVGSSDSHGTEPPVHFGNEKTIVFSMNLELASICSAIKELYSVAVESYPGENYRIYGPYRMVKYACFLMESYFPRHDELCFEEGILMKDYICGDDRAKELFLNISDRVNNYTKQFFG